MDLSQRAVLIQQLSKTAYALVSSIKQANFPDALPLAEAIIDDLQLLIDYPAADNDDANPGVAANTRRGR